MSKEKLRLAGSVAALMFIASFFLPVFFDGFKGWNGYECAQYVALATVSIFLNPIGIVRQAAGGLELLLAVSIIPIAIIYISTVLLLFLIIARPGTLFPKWIKVFYTILFFEALFVWKIFKTKAWYEVWETSMIGYYLWLASVSVVCICLWIKIKSEQAAGGDAVR